MENRLSFLMALASLLENRIDDEGHLPLRELSVHGLDFFDEVGLRHDGEPSPRRSGARR